MPKTKRYYLDETDTEIFGDPDHAIYGWELVCCLNKSSSFGFYWNFANRIKTERRN